MKAHETIRTERIYVEDVAAITGLPVRTVQTMAGQGRVPSAAKPGRRWTFNETVVRSWMRGEEIKCQNEKHQPERNGGMAHFGGAALDSSASCSLGTDNPKTAAHRSEKFKDELNGGVTHEEARYSFKEVTNAWSAAINDRVSEKTASRYLCSLHQLTPYLDSKFIDQINGALIADIVKRRRATGVSVSTIKRDLGALSSVMGFCIDEGWLEANPVLPRLGRLKERRVPIVLPELADIATVIAKARPTMKRIIAAALVTGCRQDELVKAKVINFSDSYRQLTVIGKRNKMRTIDLSDAAFAIIRAAARAATGPVLFPSEDGDYHKSVHTSFYRVVKKIGDKITRFRFHDLRHRFAVDYLKNKVGSIYELQQHLGHTSVKTTEMYLDYLSAREKQAAQFGR